MVKCVIEWDEIGRSKGTAILEFDNLESAKQVINDYDGKIKSN